MARGMPLSVIAAEAEHGYARRTNNAAKPGTSLAKPVQASSPPSMFFVGHY